MFSRPKKCLLSSLTLTLQFAPSLGAGAVRAALQAGFYPFIAADIVKLFAAATILPGIWTLVGAAHHGRP